MEWIEITHKDIDENRVTFLTNGNTVFMKGTFLNPFFIQIFGEYTTINDFVPTHWTTLPDLPGKE